MSAACGLTHHFSHDNLHIALTGRFDQSQVDALIEMLHRNHARCNRIFIDVRKVTHPQPSAVAAFKSSLRAQCVGPDQLFFKGTLGFDLAINGNRILVANNAGHERIGGKKHACKGNCAHCTCGHHQH